MPPITPSTHLASPGDASRVGFVSHRDLARRSSVRPASPTTFPSPIARIPTWNPSAITRAVATEGASARPEATGSGHDVALSDHRRGGCLPPLSNGIGRSEPRVLGSSAAGWSPRAVGDFFVDRITESDVRTWQEQVARGRAGATVNGALVMLRMLLEDAVNEYDLPKNPARRVRRLPVRRPTDEEPNLLTGPELGRVLSWLAANEPGHHAFAATLALTGLRFGEATAL